MNRETEKEREKARNTQLDLHLFTLLPKYPEHWIASFQSVTAWVYEDSNPHKKQNIELLLVGLFKASSSGYDGVYIENQISTHHIRKTTCSFVAVPENIHLDKYETRELYMKVLVL